MALTSGDYEAQANRLRSQMTRTVDELRSNLTPSKLASEAASRAGITDLSWRGAVDFASTRHPGPTTNPHDPARTPGLANPPQPALGPVG